MISNVSLNETIKQEKDDWDKRKDLIEFIMLENRCSLVKAMQILKDSEERRSNEST